MIPTSQSSVMCTKCVTQTSVTSCEGCHHKFCWSCFNKHHDELIEEFENIVHRRNELVQMIKNQTSNSTTQQSSCSEEIDRWENEMYDRISRIASKARELVEQRLKEANRSVQVELNQLSDDLQQKQKTNSYTERDLDRMQKKLVELNDRILKIKNEIRIDTTASRNIAWDSLLSIQSVNNTSSVNSTRPTNNYYAQQTNAYNSENDQRRSSVNSTRPINNTYAQQTSVFNSENDQRRSSMNSTRPINNTYTHQTSVFNSEYDPRRSSMNSIRPINNTYAQQTSIDNPEDDRARTPPPPYSYSNPPLVAMPSFYSGAYRPSISNTPVNTRTARPSTYTCIGCKTVNEFQENRQNRCSTCKQPALF